jgi:2-hydroxychromene-2-carboxylate isomerase
MPLDTDRTVQFFFDPVSPYAWLASREIGRLQAAGLEVDCRPILFAGMLKAHGQKGPAEIPAKRNYVFADVVRSAVQRGLPFKGPPGHPFNPLRALRMCVALEERKERLAFAIAVCAAAWEQGEDVSDAAVLGRVAQSCGLAHRQLDAAAEQADIKARLADATGAAIEEGVFGVPTFRFNGELFWGADRIDALLWRLKHPARDEGLLEDFLRRGPLAQRKGV